MKITEKKTQIVISFDYTSSNEISKVERFLKNWEKKNGKKLKFYSKMIKL